MNTPEQRIARQLWEAAQGSPCDEDASQGAFPGEERYAYRPPETAEEEMARVGRYFELHPPQTAEPRRIRDTYGDEDSSLPDFPHGDC